MACVFASKLIVSRAEPDTRSLRGEKAPRSAPTRVRPKASAAQRTPRHEVLILAGSCPLALPPLSSEGEGRLRLLSLSAHPAQRLKEDGAE